LLDLLEDWKRTHHLGELRADDVGKKVLIMGWVKSYRDHGGVIFVDMFDRWGITQAVFDPSESKEVHEKADRLRDQWVIAVKGRVERRPEGMKNPNLPTGEIEVRARELKILNTSLTSPFPIEDEINTSEETRLKYRYLDLRRPIMQSRIMRRHRAVKLIRDYFDNLGFLEIETPFLTKSTPEGARDYLVPSRVMPGKFYALPQSPQIFKQILMISGYDRYVQIVRCMRDEDLRADRQPEFTQIDLEMSFVEREDVFDVIERMLVLLWKEILDVEIPRPFPRVPYHEVMRKYSTDRPDTRFGLELSILTELLRGSEYNFFEKAIAEGGIIKGVRVPGAASMSRKETDDLTYALKEYGAKGLTVIRYQEKGWHGPAVKYFKEGQLDSVKKEMGIEAGDLVLMMGDREKIVNACMAQLRLMLAKKLELIPEKKYEFLWVVDFPLFEFSETDNRYQSMHHPFTSPVPEDIDKIKTAPESARSKHYDIVLNGVELGGGSIRIHQSEIQSQVFEVLGIGREEAQRKFGFLLEALQYGAPPHGGIALGLDRLLVSLLGGQSIRDVIPFPKTQSATDLMCDAPSDPDPGQLEELHIKSEGAGELAPDT